MLASHRWLRELSGLDWSADEVARRLTSAGLEVDSITVRGEGLDDIVIAEVRSKEVHPSKSGLTLVTVFDGSEERVIVCGAPNVPEAGGRVVLARLGAKLPNGLVIAPRKVAGVDSPGMLCGETELDIGSDDSGLFLVPLSIEAGLGTPIADALALRDAVFEIGLTPNRPDGLGHRGLARELCAIDGVNYAPLSTPMPITKFTNSTSDTSALAVTIEDAQRAPRYAAARVRSVHVRSSDFSTRYRLHCLGVRSISNVVDITNVIMLEWGHPIHAFDARTLSRGDTVRIAVRSAQPAETIVSLDGVARRLETGDVLVCADSTPIAIGGVMGGEASGVQADTTDVVIECAYFDPRAVRRTSRRLGMHTDASHRFERGVDPNAVRDVLQHAASLIAAACGGVVAAEAVDAYPEPIAAKRIDLRLARITALLGCEIAQSIVVSHLEAVGVTCTEGTGGSTPMLSCTVPTHRPDLTREVDLIEEVARLYGYERLPITLPRVRPSVSGTPQPILFDRAIKGAACASGLHEAICFGFVSPDELLRARVSTDAVVIANPLTADRSVMRTSLLPGLVAAAARAVRHGARCARLFELGSTFHPQEGQVLPSERKALGIFLLGEREAWFGSPRVLDFYDAKGHVEAIVHAVSGQSARVELRDELDTEAACLHPKRRGAVWIGARYVGYLGELHPGVADALELNGRGIYAHLDVDALRVALNEAGTKLAVGLPKFPAVSRDFAVLVDVVHSADALATTMRAAAELVESISLFDEYRGEHVPEGKRSLGFRIVYRDSEATLTDARVDATHAKLVAAVVREYDAKPR